MKDALRITLSHITQKSPEIRAEKATKICYYRECGYTDEQIIDKILTDDYVDFCNNIGAAIKNKNRVLEIQEIVQKLPVLQKVCSLSICGIDMQMDIRVCIRI